MSTGAVFSKPQKLIKTEDDLASFRQSDAYERIVSFIRLVCSKLPGTSMQDQFKTSSTVKVLLEMIEQCRSYITRCPPHQGAQRFGNLAFRDWHSQLEKHASSQIAAILPDALCAASVELLPYFTGSFGSSQRLDYGTGHELSFLAFVCALFQLRLLDQNSEDDLRSIALVVFPKYNALIQELVVTYTLEPAGSHGVWGLDDHFAIPYLFGAAQLSHLEPDALPCPADITKPKEVSEHQSKNLYFNAVAFINEVKKGPFWEHSPMLYDISGVPNWSKIASGMLKMYQAEVLMKYPVVQHFPFGPTFFPFTALKTSLAHAQTQNSK
ncbi:Phosphotyrosyl phosphatase activator [Protomyces lactucae-debilis]|uniref:Serine/threonine-protein phosphatase 2A activator n=1 Tax=Protomyces lactucae-debilis TaxID=2754530 RepID=A0A1Y2FUU8_PROLT|nr:Phosphotyrosyl phosphatase activator [Protomyces lactucae-debilis]ORY87739.1 Phosphotyrosyl phosphatase activator [Protomyces lactucae-debilis]